MQDWIKGLGPGFKLPLYTLLGTRCVAVCCSVLQYGAVCCNILLGNRYVAVCCSVLQYGAVCCNGSGVHIVIVYTAWYKVCVCVLQCVAVCCSVLHCVAV